MRFNLLKKTGAAAMAAAMVLNASAFSSSVVTAADAVKYEFEDGVITGTGTVKEDADASGGKYFYLESNDDTVTLTVNADSTGMYKIVIRYNAAFGNKVQNLYVNGVDQGQISFTSKTWAEIDCGAVKLNKGENEIMIKSSWGWTNFDYLTVAPAELAPITASQTSPCDASATAETCSLMSYLASVYGNNIISGQQEIYSNGPHGLEHEFEYLKDLTGHYPAIRGFDYGNFCCPAYGSDDGSTKRVIDWVKNKNGIATASFHLNVPTDFSSYTIGSRINWDQTTYSEKTDFSPLKAATEGTKENEYYMQSLTILAAEFKKLEAEGVPVIWRPLHEAEGSGGETGSWFWWGREGSEAYKKLWIYTYKTMTEKFDCHNLIWEWNSYNYATSADWYPGDEYVDIIGYDKYNCTDWSTGSPVLNHNDSAISSTFYGIMEKYNSAKMISMSENDSFSTVENLMAEKAGWLYFCTWYDGGSDNINFLSNEVFNTKQDTIDMYQSEYCITLDELPADLYSKEVTPGSTTTTKQGDTPSTTTTTTTIKPTETTTTDDEPVFEVKKYTIDLNGSAGTSSSLVLEFEGTPGAYTNGCVGYSVGKEWTSIEWETTLDADGKGKVSIDLSTIPESVESVEAQIWWAATYDAATDSNILGENELVNSSVGGAAVYGDATEDGKVGIDDVVKVMMYVANKEANPISAQGLDNADVFNRGDGVFVSDALSIQKKVAQSIDELPESVMTSGETAE